MALQTITKLSMGAAAFVAVYAVTADAQARFLDACGGLVLDADAAAKCQLVTKDTCEQQCTPVAVERVCASRLFEECDSSCQLTAEVDCQSSCTETCVPSCQTITDQPPNCMGLCMSDCQQTVTADCADDTEHGECRSSGAQCCQDHCFDQCADRNDTDCDPLCDLACSGSCVGRANIDCQVECQSTKFTSCQDEIVSECHDECQTTGAALFCDGSFLLVTDGDLQACADQLLDAFGVDIDVSIHVGGSDCDVSQDDQKDIKNALSCSVSPPDDTDLALGLLVLFGIGAWRVRRSRRESALA